MRILLIRSCCIGDVVMATAALSALRDAYPDAHITWAVGGWSRQAIDYHPAVDAILDTGQAATPVKSLAGFWQFVRQIRAGNFDIVVSLVRSPLMSLAVLLSGSLMRVGIDSNGRGFGYNKRLSIDPTNPQHEAQIYLNVVAQLGINTAGYETNLPILQSAHDSLAVILANYNIQIQQAYIVLNPNGGSNPGMLMDSKRYPISQLAIVGDALAQHYQAQLVLLGGPNDGTVVHALADTLQTDTTILLGELDFPQIGVLAASSLLYIGNDTGLTHLAAASGAKTAMILGPSDPKRYAPFIEHSIALWKETALQSGGVNAGQSETWNWQRDGISVEDIIAKIHNFLG